MALRAIAEGARQSQVVGHLLGSQDALWNLQAVVRKLHGDLLIGTVGDRLIELAAGWGIVLVVSGLYLWWPRGKSSSGVLWPRFNTRGRVFWRDLHVVTGFWGAALLLVMLLSGMTWTGFWGKTYSEVWNKFPAAMWDNVPTSDEQARDLNTAARQTVPWAVENTPMPMSGDHAEHMAHNTASSAPAAPTVSLQDVQGGLLLVSQFLLLSTSDFVPTSNFGLLTAAGLVAGQFLELALLPALLVLWSRLKLSHPMMRV